VDAVFAAHVMGSKLHMARYLDALHRFFCVLLIRRYQGREEVDCHGGSGLAACAVGTGVVGEWRLLVRCDTMFHQCCGIKTVPV
jgi:hypothetical protein